MAPVECSPIMVISTEPGCMHAWSQSPVHCSGVRIFSGELLPPSTPLTPAHSPLPILDKISAHLQKITHIQWPKIKSEYVENKFSGMPILNSILQIE